MIGFGEELNRANIFRRISSYDIFRYYSNNFRQVGEHFLSDFRNESNPSCCIAQIGNDLLYTDFGSGKSFRSIEFVMRLLGVNYFKALEIINNDFNLGLGPFHRDMVIHRSRSLNNPVVSNITFKPKPPSILQKKRRGFTHNDMQYWSQFYWTRDMLELSNTQSISHYWINGNMWTVKPDELAFSYEYYWHNGRMQRKLYFPSRINYRWFSNVDDTIVQLVDVAPKQGDILVITSSKKDAGIFWRMQLDGMLPELVIHGVAPNNEHSFVPLEWFKKMQTRWEHIVLWYNNDDTGIRKGKKFRELYDIPYFYNPLGSPKDPSDYAKELGLKDFFNYFKTKIDELYPTVP